jgi:hypothetical protein
MSLEGCSFVLPLVSGNHDRIFTYPHARIWSFFCLKFCGFYERNIRGFAKGFCVSAVLNLLAPEFYI